MLIQYDWPGNIRQLKNITEQISIIEKRRDIDGELLRKYLPDYMGDRLPALINSSSDKSFASEREILYKILFDMKNDMNDLKKLVHEIIEQGSV
jgi:DNA-binding NtrC family response regulator